jgi:hypothetical protein
MVERGLLEGAGIQRNPSNSRFSSFTTQNSPKQGRRAEISAGFHFFGDPSVERSWN